MVGGKCEQVRFYETLFERKLHRSSSNRDVSQPFVLDLYYIFVALIILTRSVSSSLLLIIRSASMVSSSPSRSANPKTRKTPKTKRMALKTKKPKKATLNDEKNEEDRLVYTVRDA